MGLTMKRIYKIILITLAISCSSNKVESNEFILDPSKPVEVGIESFKKNNTAHEIIAVYMINHQPVSGIQFQIEPNDFFLLDSVYGGRLLDYDFQLHHNPNGKILAFSMSGKTIDPSSSLNKEDNLLFFARGKTIRDFNEKISISPIVASINAEKLECISVPFELIAK